LEAFSCVVVSRIETQGLSVKTTGNPEFVSKLGTISKSSIAEVILRIHFPGSTKLYLRFWILPLT
jgi:hypothetical protein